MTGQKKTSEKPPSTTGTTYEISKLIPGDVPSPNAAKSPMRMPTWQPVGTVTTTGGARAAIKEWAEKAGESFAGGDLRAVPKSNITVVTVAVKTVRQLTLGAA